MINQIEIVRLDSKDLFPFKKFVSLLNEVFDEYHTIGSDQHLQKLLDKEDFYAIIAIQDGIIIGGLTAYKLQKYYTNKNELYIYDIAVKKELQNQGVGKMLIQFLKEIGKNDGIETIFVEAHSEDKQAVKFYESTFGKSEKVDHFNFEISSLN